METITELFSDAVKSIIDTKKEVDVDGLFKTGGAIALISMVSGLEDFELICFMK